MQAGEVPALAVGLAVVGAVGVDAPALAVELPVHLGALLAKEAVVAHAAEDGVVTWLLIGLGRCGSLALAAAGLERRRHHRQRRLARATGTTLDHRGRGCGRWWGGRDRRLCRRRRGNRRGT